MHIITVSGGMTVTPVQQGTLSRPGTMVPWTGKRKEDREGVISAVRKMIENWGVSYTLAAGGSQFLLDAVLSDDQIDQIKRVSPLVKVATSQARQFIPRND